MYGQHMPPQTFNKISVILTTNPDWKQAYRGSYGGGRSVHAAAQHAAACAEACQLTLALSPPVVACAVCGIDTAGCCVEIDNVQLEECTPTQ